MNATTLILAYEHRGKAVSLARVRNPRLLRVAMRAALSEKRREVTALGRLDTGLAVIAEGELQSMKRTLGRLLPRLGRL